MSIITKDYDEPFVAEIGTFGWALEAMRQGEDVRRKSWYIDEACVYLMEELTIEGQHFLPYFEKQAVEGCFQPGWLPSTEDLLATDWEIA